MSKDAILANLKGQIISDIVFSIDEPPKILAIITASGLHVDTATGAISQPKREIELAEFLEKLSDLRPGDFFTFDPAEIAIDEMRGYAYEHAKKINANGGNVVQIYNGQFKVTMGEDLAELRRGFR